MMSSLEFVYVYSLFLHQRCEKADLVTAQPPFTGCKEICGWEEDYGSAWAP